MSIEENGKAPKELTFLYQYRYNILTDEISEDTKKEFLSQEVEIFTNKKTTVR